MNEFPITVSSSQPAVLVFKELPEKFYGKSVSLRFTSALSPDDGVYVYDIPGLENSVGPSENSSNVQITYTQKQDPHNSEIVSVCFTVHAQEE